MIILTAFWQITEEINQHFDLGWAIMNWIDILIVGMCIMVAYTILARR